MGFFIYFDVFLGIVEWQWTFTVVYLKRFSINLKYCESVMENNLSFVTGHNQEWEWSLVIILYIIVISFS